MDALHSLLQYDFAPGKTLPPSMPDHTATHTEQSLQDMRTAPEQPQDGSDDVVPYKAPTSSCAAEQTSFPFNWADEEKIVNCVLQSLGSQDPRFSLTLRDDKTAVLSLDLKDLAARELGPEITAQCSCGAHENMALKVKLEVLVEHQDTTDRPLPCTVEMHVTALRDIIMSAREPYSVGLKEEEMFPMEVQKDWYARDYSKQKDTVMARAFACTNNTEDIRVALSALPEHASSGEEGVETPLTFDVKVSHWTVRLQRNEQDLYTQMPLLSGPSFAEDDKKAPQPPGYLIDRLPNLYEDFNKHTLERLSDKAGVPFRRDTDPQGGDTRYVHHFLTPQETCNSDRLYRLTDDQIRHVTSARIGKLLELQVPSRSQLEGISAAALASRFGTEGPQEDSCIAQWETVLENQETALPEGDVRVSLDPWKGQAEFFSQHEEVTKSSLGEPPIAINQGTWVKGHSLSREGNTLTVYSAGNIAPTDQMLHTLVPAAFMWDDGDGAPHRELKLVRMTVYDTATCHASTHWQRQMLTERETRDQQKAQEGRTDCARKGTCSHATG